MAIVKNYGLGGLASDVQLGKGGPRLLNSGGTFVFKQLDGSTNAEVVAQGFTSSNGNLILGTTNLSEYSAGVVQVDSTGAFYLPAGTTAQRPSTGTLSNLGGLLRANTDTSSAATLEYWNGSAWITLSTGGSIVALQAEVDAIEVSLGAAINNSGVFVPSGFTGPVIGTVASFTEAIQNVADYTEAHDTLDEIFPSTANGNVIYSAAGVWEQAAPGLTSGVQAYNAKLTSVASNATNGIIVQTSGTAVTSRSLVQPTAGLTITNADGVAGNPTFALADDLAALEGLTTTGYIVRTGDGTATTRSLTGTAGNIVVTNGSGVASDTSFNLATVSQAATGSFVKVTLDGFGRVTGNTPVVSSDITSLVDSTYLRTDGSNSMTADLNVGGFLVTNVADPVSGNDAATKNYVDNAVTGLSWKQAANAMSVTNVPLTGGATLTVDGVSIANGNRLLLTGQTDPYQNGIYSVAGIGTAYTLTRSTDANTFEELNGAAIFILAGTVYDNSGWTQSATLTSLTTGATQVWTQFSGAGSYTGGTGIDVTGNVISAKLGAGIASVPTGEIGIDLYNASTGALILTSDGSTRGTATGDALALLLNASGGLAQDVNGLKISAAGVTNAMLVNSDIGLNADAGTSSVALGQTLEVAGNSVQGIATSVTGQTITVSGIDASTTQKGVASFATATFSVTAGAVDIKAGGISNSQLNTVDVPHGGTGATSFTADQLLIGAGTSPITSSSSLTFSAGVLSAPSVTLSGMTAGRVVYTGTGGALTSGANFTTDGANMTIVNDITAGGTVQGSVLHSTGGITGAALTVTGAVTSLVANIGNLSISGQTVTGNSTNADIVFAPNGTGQVVIGNGGPGYVSADAGENLILLGDTGLVLSTNTGEVDVNIGGDLVTKFTVGATPTDYFTVTTDGTNGVQIGASGGDLGLVFAGTTNILKVVSGPTAAQYAAAVTSAGGNAIPNKQYVTDAVAAAGSATGTVKAYKATVSIANGTTNIGSALPAGSTVTRVKINVTAAATAGTIAVGVAGNTGRYADTASNDPESTGLYISENYDTDGSSVQVIATVAGATGSGSANILVEYVLP